VSDRHSPEDARGAASGSEDRPEPVFPDDAICADCFNTRLKETNRERDGFAWWVSFICPVCGATGEVEQLFSDGSNYHGDVTTPRRADLECREVPL